MIFKKEKKQPVRLYKRKEKKGIFRKIKEMNIMSDQEILFITVFIIMFVLIAIFAFWESMAFFVYNTGL